MITRDIKAAIEAAQSAKAEDLRGLYPSACIVMAAFLERIAFPRRGTKDEKATIHDFAEELQAVWPKQDL